VPVAGGASPGTTGATAAPGTTATSVAPLPPLALPPPVPAPVPAPAASTPSSTPPSETPTSLAPTSPLATPGAAATGAAHPVVELTSLRLLREKGVISKAEYDSAVKDMAESVGQAHAGDQTSVVLGKWATTMYGFVESDFIYDTTRAFNDLAGAGLVPRAESQNGQNGRFTVGVRNSRIGFRVKAPELPGGIRTSAMLEMDFLGTQAVGTGTGQVSEGAFLTQPLFRIRHFNFKVETPVVDFLVGQYWQLFGWQSVYQPNTVELQGVPGELYSRTPQLRISKTVKAESLTVEIAAALTRPVQRDAATPDGQAGIRVALESWTGVQTVGATGSTVSPLSIAATMLYRHVAVDQLASKPKTTNDLGLNAFAIDAFLPLIPGTKKQKDSSFSLNGEYATGYGFADMYSGLSGGVGYPSLPPPAGSMTPATYTPDIDSGIVTYDASGALHGIQWTTYLIGGQYYVPGVDGRVWVSGNYSHTSSDNIGKYGSPTAVRDTEDWFDVNLFVDPTPAVRLGFEYANFNDMYYDGHHAINHRGQFSGFFIF
jgi:hypothetical protein